MKTVKIGSPVPSVVDLLNMAREDVVIVTTEEGDSFVISTADEFEAEVQLLRRNRAFVAMLDRFKEDQESLSLDEAEKNLCPSRGAGEDAGTDL